MHRRRGGREEEIQPGGSVRHHIAARAPPTDLLINARPPTMHHTVEDDGDAAPAPAAPLEVKARPPARLAAAAAVPDWARGTLLAACLASAFCLYLLAPTPGPDEVGGRVGPAGLTSRCLLRAAPCGMPCTLLGASGLPACSPRSARATTQIFCLCAVQRLFTAEQLGRYKNGGRRLYLAIVGQVFDVSMGARHYGAPRGLGGSGRARGGEGRGSALEGAGAGPSSGERVFLRGGEALRPERAVVVDAPFPAPLQHEALSALSATSSSYRRCRRRVQARAAGTATLWAATPASPLSPGTSRQTSRTTWRGCCRSRWVWGVRV